MAFPESILTKDEKVERSMHPHWLTLVFPVLSGILLIAATWLIVAMTPVDNVWDVVDWVIIGIAVLLFFAFVIVPFLRWVTTHYVITNKRVVVRRGILSKSGQDIALSKITDVSFHQSLLDRIIRSGSLHIETAGDNRDEDFSNIPRSNQVQQQLNHLIEEDAARRGGYGYAAHRGYEQTGAPMPDDEPVTRRGRGRAPEPQRQPEPGPAYAPEPTYPPEPTRDDWETPPPR